MKIQFNTDKTITGNERDQSYFTSMIADGLKNYESHITRIESHLSDENEKRMDKRICAVYWKLELKVNYR